MTALAACLRELSAAGRSTFRQAARHAATNHHRNQSLALLCPDLCDRPLSPFRVLRPEYEMYLADPRFRVTREIMRSLGRRINRALADPTATPWKIVRLRGALLREYETYQRQRLWHERAA